MRSHHLVCLHLSVAMFGHEGLLAQCPDGSPPPCTRASARPPAPNSVAVLYFDNLSRDTADALSVLALDLDAREAERLARRAVALDPREAQGHMVLSNALFAAGRMDESIDEARRGWQADSLSRGPMRRWATSTMAWNGCAARSRNEPNGWPYVRADAELAPLRTDPRYAALDRLLRY